MGGRERKTQRERVKEREKRESDRETEREIREIREKQSNRQMEKKHSYNNGICMRLYLRVSYRMLVAECQR